MKYLGHVFNEDMSDYGDIFVDRSEQEELFYVDNL